MRPALCIVLPVLDEASALAEQLRALQGLRSRGARVVVVDGGSQDETLAIAREHADLALLAPRGRASQMNAGAAACPADVLLFLHADTALPEAADTLIARALDQRDWGRFDVRIEGRHPALRLIAAMMNLRSRLSGVATGDQAVFVRRRVFESLGGFAALPLMEDLDLCRRLKRQGPPVCLREQVVTSGRRWEQYGVWRIVWLMWRLRAAWFFGADAHAHGTVQRLALERHVAQVRQEPALGLVVRVADLVTNLRPLGRQFAAPRHGEKSLCRPGPP